MERCVWEYRPSITKAHHFAISSCDNGQRFLSKITGQKQCVGCADVYEWKLCPICGKPIQMNYSYFDIKKIDI